MLGQLKTKNIPCLSVLINNFYFSLCQTFAVSHICGCQWIVIEPPAMNNLKLKFFP